MARSRFAGILLALSVGLLCTGQAASGNDNAWLQKHWKKGAAAAVAAGGVALVCHLARTRFVHDTSHAQRESLRVGDGLVARLVQGFAIEARLVSAFRCKWFDKVPCGTRVTATVARPAGGASIVWGAVRLMHNTGTLQRALEIGIEAILSKHVCAEDALYKGRLVVHYKFMRNGDLKIVGYMGDADYVEHMRRDS